MGHPHERGRVQDAPQPLTCPSRAGKTFLLRRLFPKASYFLLEDPHVVARLRADPQGFLDEVKTPAIFDEVQNVPEILAHIRARIDRQPRRVGQWLLTGSPKVTSCINHRRPRLPPAPSPRACAPGRGRISSPSSEWTDRSRK
jgi:hypothetical protein